MGLMLIRARAAPKRALFPGQRISRHELISFCFHIQQIARSHASLLDGLKDLVAGAENTRFRDLLILMTDDLEGGKLLSEALAAHPDVFDRVFLALVRAAEKSDQIETVFVRLETRLKQQEELQAEFTRLLIYPGITALAVLAAAGVMLFYLTPRLASLIASLNLPMPVATRMLIALSELALHHLPWLLGLLLRLNQRRGNPVGPVRGRANASRGAGPIDQARPAVGHVDCGDDLHRCRQPSPANRRRWKLMGSEPLRKSVSWKPLSENALPWRRFSDSRRPNSSTLPSR